MQTDISDFYLRIYHHRIENCLDTCAPNHGAARFIKNYIKHIRAKQSFGIPVGGSAARLIAELVMADTDRALAQQGVLATRFVDDFRLFLKPNQDAYDVLGFLAEHLALGEGLTLNSGKTEVFTAAQYSEKLQHQSTDFSKQANEVAFESLMKDIYFDDDPDPDDFNALSNETLVNFLDEELQKDTWDVSRIRRVFQALNVVAPVEAIPYIIANFQRLIPFAKELCTLMQVLEGDEYGCFDNLAEEIISAILGSPASSVQQIRSWLLEIIVRRVVYVTPAQLNKIKGLDSVWDRRQLLLLRGIYKDDLFFRNNKTKFASFSPLEQNSLIIGATCLPKDEFDVWSGVVKGWTAGPLSQLFLQWTRKHKASILTKLGRALEDDGD